MKAHIVVGANYGDESKGTVTARLTKGSSNVLNIMTNGGSQRGHSILTKDGTMTFQHFGSGTYYGADNYYSEWFILNPMQFAAEYVKLIVKPKYIYRSPFCMWSTPYDVMANLIDEEQRGRKASCGMGIWMTKQRYNNTFPMLFDYFMQRPGDWISYLEDIRRYYEQRMTIPDNWRDVWNDKGVLRHFLEDCMMMRDKTVAAYRMPSFYENLIFENGQGLLLGDTGKDLSDRTPSLTGIDYAMNMVRRIGIDDVTVHYVTRPYLTRHGDGHIMNERQRKDLSSDIKEDRTNHHNEHQGAFRYGWLDIPQLYGRCHKDARGAKFELDITHCDEMDREAEFRRYFDVTNFYDTPMV